MNQQRLFCCFIVELNFIRKRQRRGFGHIALKKDSVGSLKMCFVYRVQESASHPGATIHFEKQGLGEKESRDSRKVGLQRLNRKVAQVFEDIVLRMCRGLRFGG